MVIEGKQCLLSFKTISVRNSLSLCIYSFCILSIGLIIFSSFNLVYSNIQDHELLFANMTVMMGLAGELCKQKI